MGYITLIKMLSINQINNIHKDLKLILKYISVIIKKAKKIISTVFDGIVTENKIKEQIQYKILEKFYGDVSEGLDIYMHDVNFFVVGLENKGGCASCKNVHMKMKYKNRTIKLISPKSSNDNCLFMCFVTYLKQSGNAYNFVKIREELNLQGKISFEDVNKVAKCIIKWETRNN